ncbi:hypothetical protein LTS18_005552 [Coniosporium uncinatum]|uniref:Uncharacterized protein n=1 Tax=Coniosporium uncinatum TaxID=93489 RepID=A0ACC3DR81_9PEZI|nr:hypothetical protein LTS18_005552 [Coniosporium uncinatum]
MAIDAWEFESKKNRSLRMRGPGKMEWVDIGEGKEVVLDVQGAGGHNMIMTYTPLTLAVLKAFEAP